VLDQLQEHFGIGQRQPQATAILTHQ